MFNSPDPNCPRDGDDLSSQQNKHQSQLKTFRCVEYDSLGGLLITLSLDDLIPTFLDLVDKLPEKVGIFLDLFHPETQIETKYRNISSHKSVVTSHLSASHHQLLLVTPNYAELSVCAIKESDSLEIRICRNKSILIFCEDPIRRSVFEGVLRNKGFAGLPPISPTALSHEIQAQENRSQVPLQILQECFTQMIRDLGLEEMNSGGDSQE